MTDDDKKTALALLAMPTVMVGLGLIGMVFGLVAAWAVQKMYGWFLLPLGLPELNLWHFYGLILIVNILKGTKSDSKKKKWPDIFGTAIGNVIGILLVVLIGYIIKGWI